MSPSEDNHSLKLSDMRWNGLSTFRLDQMASGVSIDLNELRNAQQVARINPDGTREYVQGGFGSLWRAGVDGHYAIKCFHVRGNNGDEVRQAAAKEFELLTKLNDTGYTPVVYCTGWFTDDNGVASPAIVEAYIKGATLQQVISSGLLSGSVGRGMDAARASIIALEVAKALNCLAECGISHRDLSTANIMLTDECLKSELSHGAKVILIDFGQSTQSTRAIVTPRLDSRLAYVPSGAPEVFGGEFRPMRNSSKCDTWSLGSIIVAMMSGEEYWPASIDDLRNVNELSREALDRIAEAKRPPLDLVALAHLTTPTREEYALADIVRSCTIYNPRLRSELKDIIVTLEEYVKAAPERVTPIVKRSESVSDADPNASISSGDCLPQIHSIASTDTNDSDDSPETLVLLAGMHGAAPRDSEISVPDLDVSEQTGQDEDIPSDVHDEEPGACVSHEDETDPRGPQTSEEHTGGDSEPETTMVESELTVQGRSLGSDTRGRTKGIEYLLETRQIDHPDHASLVYLRNHLSRKVNVSVLGMYSSGAKRPVQHCMRLAPGGKGFVAFKHPLSDVSISDVSYTSKLSPAERLHWSIEYVNSARGLVRLDLFNRTDTPIRIREIVAIVDDSNGVIVRTIGNSKALTLPSRGSTTVDIDDRRISSVLIGNDCNDNSDKTFALYVDGVEIHNKSFYREQRHRMPPSMTLIACSQQLII